MTGAQSFAQQNLFGIPSILIATPNSSLRRRLCDELGKMTSVDEVGTGAEALGKLERRGARLLLLDRRLPDLHSDELIGVVERQFPGTDVVLLDGESGRIQMPDELCDGALYRWLRELSLVDEPVEDEQSTEIASGGTLLPGIVGTSEALRESCALVRVVAPHATAVLITGETGAGKELVAEAVHRLSPRSERPFVVVNCAAIPETLIEAELFGHTRGAFTGAVQSRVGRIHAAQGGSIFFDEIGELPLASQGKLLRFLESGEVQRLGTSDVFRLDVRVIAATNVDLEKRVEQGLFREDLFYRLSVFPIEVPPLRERREDILPLARFFVERLAGEGAVALSEECGAKLTAHHWPGNVRELRNVIERAFVLSNGGRTIKAEHIQMRKPCRSVAAPSESS
jgi:transcriptional regulator with GAF, ATPase, and Fis domain